MKRRTQTMNRFILNETSYHGAGAIAAIKDEVQGRGFKKAFVCSGPDLIRFGLTKKVTDVLDSAGISYEIFSDIKPNPTIENVQAGVAAFKAAGADCIVAIGGGSPIDTAKAVGIITANPEFADVRSLEAMAFPTREELQKSEQYSRAWFAQRERQARRQRQMPSFTRMAEIRI